MGSVHPSIWTNTLHCRLQWTFVPAGRAYGSARCKLSYARDIIGLLRQHNVSLCLSDHHHAPAPWIATASHAPVDARRLMAMLSLTTSTSSAKGPATCAGPNRKTYGFITTLVQPFSLSRNFL